MDLKPLRQALSLADDAVDDAVISKAVETLASEKQRADAATAKALTLSDSIPRKIDPEILADRALNFSDKLALLVEKGQCTPAQRDAIVKYISPNDQPNALMLSESIAKGPTGLILKVLELNDALKTGQQTNTQTVGRTTPGATDEDPAKEGALIAQDYQSRQLKSRGLS